MPDPNSTSPWWLPAGQLLDLQGDGLLIVDARKGVIYANRTVLELWNISSAQVQGQSLDVFFSPTAGALDPAGPISSRLSELVGRTAEIQGKFNEEPHQRSLSISVTHAMEERDEAVYAIQIKPHLPPTYSESKLSGADYPLNLLARINHEIRNPVNGIQGLSLLLKNSELNTQQKYCVETIYLSSDFLLHTVDDILDLAKLEAGKVSFHRVQFELHPLIETAAGLYAPAAHAKKIELICDIDPALPVFLKGDPHRLRQVITNLVGNAVKFTREGQVLIRATTAPRLHDTHLLIEVIDTGIGVEKRHQEKLFQPFHQASPTIYQEYGGTGLGLAISKQLIELMGGSIGFESEFGRGSRFWIELPLASMEPVEAQESCGTGPALAGQKVCLAIWNASLRELMVRILRVHGTEVAAWEEEQKVAAWLKEQILSSSTPLIILLDYDWDTTNGLTIARELRETFPSKMFSVVLLKRLTEILDAVNLRDAGIARTLLKPIRQWDLLECLDQIKHPLENILLSAYPAQANPLTPPASQEDISAPRILIADDQEVNRKVALGFLGKLGYHANTVTQAHEVLRALQDSRYDIVFLDCQFPGKGGLEIVREIRRLEASQNTTPTYIIALTGNSSAESREECFKAGMNDFLTKPIQVSELQQALQRAVQHTGVTQNPPDSERSQSLDPATIHSLRDLKRGMEPDPIIELIDLFIEGAMTRIREMESAITQRDPHTLVFASHSLKGCASNMGARRLEQMAATLEQCGNTRDFDSAGLSFRQLKAEFERVHLALEEEKTRPSSS